MQYWLFKSEPTAYSWDDLVKLGSDCWDGVRNYQACNNMKAMKVGDRGFFYHSVKEKRIVGVVEVIKEAYPDFTDPSNRFYMVDVKPLYPLKTPVTLADIKANPKLAEMKLIKQSRLSVCPIMESEWKIICKMGRVED